MKTWPRYPIIYLINTWVWLQELGRGKKTPVTLASVPKKEWDALAALGIDAVWFMGVWERSPAGIEVSMRNQGLLDDFRRALPDFVAADNVGSPYCVRNYVVDPHLGGAKGLAVARKELARRGLRLMLDFVPNHVAPDHPWVTDHPDYFIKGNYGDSVREPAAFLAAGGNVFACGKDPFFPAWPDVLQLNAFNPGLRAAVIDTVKSIADQCDGVRCDMAMLVMNDIFQRTWGDRAGARPDKEYWPELIGAVRATHPGFLFMAEAYWDLEWALQQHGFDFCYDKKLYDRLEHDPAEAIRLHLCADMAYQERLVRFIENHDEPRAAATFFPEKERASAVLTSTLQGAVLLHEGQFEGRKVRLPVFLGRRPDEPPDPELRAFYANLLQAIAKEGLRRGEWRLCDREGWPDNQSCTNIVAWCWDEGDKRHLVAVNLSEQGSQGKIRLPWGDLADCSWTFTDLLDGTAFAREGADLRDNGLYVDLGPWRFHFCSLRRNKAARKTSKVPL
ncbi:MAG TPA: alpha-amylase family glycosyl hydrolase [Geobacteraceae bacterium]|nr:alpha-amylase family glycosyl hydrolase [Geobacteraceae bacterium]